MRFTLALLCLCGLHLVAACLPPGQKLLRMDVLHREEVVLTTLFDAADRSTVSELWDAAGRRPFATELAATSLGAGAAGALEATLTGPVEIRITHTSTPQTSALLTDLTLVRSAPGARDWHLPAPEITRARRAASR